LSRTGQGIFPGSDNFPQSPANLGRRQSGWKSERCRGTERALIFVVERLAEIFNRSDGAGSKCGLAKGLAGKSVTQRATRTAAGGGFLAAVGYQWDRELSFAPFVSTTNIRVPHALNMWGYARIQLSCSFDCFCLRRFNCAGSVCVGSPCRRWMIGKRNGRNIHDGTRNQSCCRWISGRLW
jgi:hypothetical protein